MRRSIYNSFQRRISAARDADDLDALIDELRLKHWNDEQRPDLCEMIDRARFLIEHPEVSR